ncbi:MAG: iron ABC transporter ATP-binding protein [Acidobacteria bacterium]|nr:MAG: iron ABC transporter ATP-binding protein [Acidobacteriota bacterium]
MITIDRVTHRYGSTTVLDDVSLELPAGRVTSVIGPNGAGKSTLFSVVSRLLRPSAGRVTVDGLDVTSARDTEVARRLAVLRQDNQVAARLTVLDLVRFGRFPHSGGRLTPECHAKVEEALAWLKLDPLRDRYLDQLSGGQRQRAFIAMVLAQDTDYLLLDEPLNNLDMKHSAAMMSLVRRAVDELGKTAVVVMHDINFASAYSDHIVAMRDGAVVAAGTPAQIMRREVLQDVFDMDIHVQDLNGMRLGIFWTPGAPVPPPSAVDLRDLLAGAAEDLPQRPAQEGEPHTPTQTQTPSPDTVTVGDAR